VISPIISAKDQGLPFLSEIMDKLPTYAEATAKISS
jgi:hypothetical protein